MQELKLVIVDTSYRQYRNDLVNALLNLGIDVTVVAPYNREDLDILDNVRWLNPITGNINYSFLKIKLFRLMHHSIIVTNNIIERDKVVYNLNPSIIHMQGISFPLFELFLARKFTIPKILTVHNIIPHEKFIYNSQYFLKKAYKLKGFDSFIVHSALSKRILSSFYPPITNKIFVIPHGCSKKKLISKGEARVELNLPVNLHPLILFFGNIRRYKGLSYLIKSLSYVKNHFSDVKLVIAGKVLYDKFDRYLKIIENKHLKEKIILRIGHIPEDEVDLYFQAADLLVLPYTDFTAQSGVLLRAYANQCPVVVTDVGAMGETVKNDNSGILVSPRDINSLSQGIVKILKDKNMQERIKEIMLSLVQKKYNWQKVAQQTINLYYKILHKKLCQNERYA